MSMAFCSNDSISLCLIFKALLFCTQRSSADTIRLTENTANVLHILPAFFDKTQSAKNLIHSKWMILKPELKQTANPAIKRLPADFFNMSFAFVFTFVFSPSYLVNPFPATECSSLFPAIAKWMPQNPQYNPRMNCCCLSLDNFNVTSNRNSVQLES